MKRALFMAVILPMFLSTFSDAAESSEHFEAVSNYLAIAAQMNNVAAQNSTATQTVNRIQARLKQQVTIGANSANQQNGRFDLAQNLFTNLVQLQAASRQTAVVTNIDIKPPGKMSRPLGADIDQISDPEEQEEMQAYYAARKAYTELWNLYRRLENESASCKLRVLQAVANAYSRPPATDEEIQRVVAAVSDRHLTTEFSDLVRRKLEEDSQAGSRSRDGLPLAPADPVSVDPQTGLVLSTNTIHP